MMTRLQAIVQALGPGSVAVALLGFTLMASAGVARAEEAAGAASPVEEFSQQLEAFQNSPNSRRLGHCLERNLCRDTLRLPSPSQ